ncbi:MAG: immunoglobulin domain-containing protein [Verrucomicrobiota bacterium]
MVVNGPGDSGTLNPYDGQQWIVFNAGNTAPGGILSQSFATTVGESYSVSFAVGRAGSGPISLTATAIASDSTVLASNYCVPPTSGVWTIFQMAFTAATTNTTLVFKDTSTVTVAVDMGFDDVTVVGEPTTGIPVVVTSPASQTVNAGAVVSFSASAAGSPSTLQWYLGTNEVNGAAGNVSPLTVTANDGTAGNYVAVFSNSFGMATTAVAVLTVVDPPVITISPVSQVVAAGTPVTFTAAASGSPSTVQWYFGTLAIAGGTGTNLTFTAFASSTGNYKAVFSNGAGTATTAVATLTVNAGPFTNGGFELINNHAALAGNYATTISVGSTWLNNWSVGGSPGHTLVAKGTYDGFAPYEGQQFLFFAAGGGSVSQTFATLPGVHYALWLAAGKYGSAGVVSVMAAGWADDGTLLSSNRFAPASGAWTLYPFGFTATTTNTTLVLTDSSTGTSGLDLVLDDVTLVSAPVIVTSPLSQTNLLGTTATFTASASGSPATVQWYQGTSSLLNATNTTLSFTVNGGSGGNYTAVFTNAAGSATTAVAVLTVDLPAVLTQQPQSVTTNVGATVTFTGAAGGTAPLSFQWQFDGTNLDGATGASLVLTNAQPTNAGSYTLVAANAYGTNISTNAVLSFISTVQVGSGTTAVTIPVTMAGVSIPVNMTGVIVPVNLLATGAENGTGFTLNYDPSILTYVGATLGSGAPGGTFGVNAKQAGSLGLAVILPGGTTFAAGTQQIVQVTFQVGLVTSATPTTIGFGDVPTPRGISDTNGIAIPGAYLAGMVTVEPTPLEGDVAPVGNEDFVVGITDWVQEGRYVAGLDPIPNASAFQRADCAPRDTLGDSLITVEDWVQVGRYYLGLDPPTPQGGPTGPPSNSVVVKPAGQIKPQDGVGRMISLSPVTQGAMADTAVVQMVAQGDEAALQFSVSFDPTALSFAGANKGSGAAGATLIVNATNAARGQVGIVLGMLGGSFASGTQNLVTLNFNSISYSNTTTLVFGDTPILCRVADTNAKPVSASYQNGSLQVAGMAWPQLGISQSAGGITLTWPAAPTVLAAQWTTNLGANWASTGGTAVTNGGTVYLTLPAPTHTTFYRLTQP